MHATPNAALHAHRLPDPTSDPTHGPTSGPAPLRRVARAFWPQALLAAAFVVCAPLARAEVESVTLEVREPYFANTSIPDVGPYERLVGTVVYAFDPADPGNAAIVDLERAPRDADGLVRASGDIVVLQPVDPERRSGTGFLEVVNRGRFASLSYFQGAPARDPRVEGDAGDGWLFRQGLTLIWVGWQFDVPEGERRLRLRVPRLGDEVRGFVRCDWVVDEATDTLALGHHDHVPYAIAEPESERHVLTVRRGRNGERRRLPRESWRFARRVDGEVVADPRHIHVPAGFEPGRLYELVYEGRDPAVVGLGLAAVRDVMSFAKHDPACAFPVERGVAFGVSQTGRFLRHFLYQGFNVDPAGRTVFDGMLIHSAGAGRGSFNHRFAQPSRDAHRYSAFSYPTDLFPFSGRAQRDAQLARTEGLLSAPRQLEHLPKIVATNTGYEYWGRAASLMHTSLDGSADVALLENERVYHLSSGQHFVAPNLPPKADERRAPRDGPVGYRGNPVDFRFALRALTAALLAWVEDGTPPPDATLPRIADGTLVPLHRLAFPEIPGWPAPRVLHEVRRRDYGPRFARGILDVQPPKEGAAYATLVPQVDAYGNERGGWPMLELAVPLATYTPWRLRSDFAHERDELEDFWGNLIPLPRTEEERERTGDARPSLETLYSDETAFLEAARYEARRLVDRGYLLEEDLQAVLRRAATTWRLVHGS